MVQPNSFSHRAGPTILPGGRPDGSFCQGLQLAPALKNQPRVIRRLRQVH